MRSSTVREAARDTDVSEGAPPKPHDVRKPLAHSAKGEAIRHPVPTIPRQWAHMVGIG